MYLLYLRRRLILCCLEVYENPITLNGLPDDFKFKRSLYLIILCIIRFLIVVTPLRFLLDKLDFNGLVKAMIYSCKVIVELFIQIFSTTRTKLLAITSGAPEEDKAHRVCDVDDMYNAYEKYNASEKYGTQKSYAD